MKLKLILITVFILSGCDFRGVDQGKSRLDPELIKEIYIKKALDDTDSAFLDKQQIEAFVKVWNQAKLEGPRKFGAEFSVYVNLKNDSVRVFRTNSKLIQEQGVQTYSLLDSALISSFWHIDKVFDRPENYDPISFINQMAMKLKLEKNTSIPCVAMSGDIPENWVKEEHIVPLMKIMESEETCGCFLNPLSSFIPTDDFAEKGGYAAVFLKAYKENRKVDLGLYACPKRDVKLNKELRKWWEETRQGKRN